MLLTVFAAVVATTPAATAPLDLETVLRRARPAAERLGADSLLADAARELSLSRGILLEGPTLSVAGGPRRSPEGDDSDLALGIDLPLGADRSERAAALATFESAEKLLPAAAAIEAELALRLAYVDAWSAAERTTLAERDVETAERWLTAVRRRVDAGADPPYEAVLVEAELAAARLSWSEARQERVLAWGALAARTEVDAMPSPLVEPDVPAGAPPPAETARSSEAVVGRAITARVDLERALVALEAARAASRFSLAGEVEREGEEEVAHVGLAYRLPLGGERAARARALDAAVARVDREAEIERAALAARVSAAAERAAASGLGPDLAPETIARALAALDARLAAGKERPSEILPARRQLFDAAATALAVRAARLRVAYELDALTRETLP